MQLKDIIKQRIEGLQEELSNDSYSAYNLDSLIEELKKIKAEHGNIGLAIKTPSHKWSTEGVSIEINKIDAYNHVAKYACIS